MSWWVRVSGRDPNHTSLTDLPDPLPWVAAPRKPAGQRKRQPKLGPIPRGLSAKARRRLRFHGKVLRAEPPRPPVQRLGNARHGNRCMARSVPPGTRGIFEAAHRYRSVQAAALSTRWSTTIGTNGSLISLPASTCGQRRMTKLPSKSSATAVQFSTQSPVLMYWMPSKFSITG